MAKRTRALIAGGVVVVLATAAAVVLTRGGNEPAPSAASPPSTPAVTQPQTPSPSASPEGPVTVSGIVRVEPLDGWVVRRLFLTHNPPYIRLVSDQVRLNVLAGRFDGSPSDLAQSYADQFVLPFAKSSSLEPTRHWQRLPSGVMALRLVYQGPFAPDGDVLVHELTVLTSGANGVVFDDWATPQLLDGARQDLARMIDSARIAGS